jgi:leucyl aminopeptidase
VRSANPALTLVGKGITFDSGGLSLKSAAPMQGMKRDMAGAGVVAAVMLTLAELQVPFGVRAYLPIAENMPGSTAYRPGDVITLFGGHTVEVSTTDAEGRLVLAEAVVTAYQEGAGDLIEVSTLTGSAVLGPCLSGVMGETDLVRAITRAAEAAGERLWPMPLPAELHEGLRSDIADLHQVIPGQEWEAPMLQGGAFLGHFVPAGARWAHIDIGGQVSRPSLRLPSTQEATGVPVSTLVRLILDRAASG